VRRTIIKDLFKEVLTEWIKRARDLELKLEEHLIKSAPKENTIRSLVRLKKELLKMTSSEANFSEAKLSEATSSEAVERWQSTSTECTTTKSARTSATCLLYKTRITTLFAEIVSSLIGMDLNSILHRTTIKSGKGSLVKIQGFSQDKLLCWLVLNVSQILYK